MEIYQFVFDCVIVKMWTQRNTCARQNSLDWIGLFVLRCPLTNV